MSAMTSPSPPTFVRGFRAALHPPEAHRFPEATAPAEVEAPVEVEEAVAVQPQSQHQHLVRQVVQVRLQQEDRLSRLHLEGDKKLQVHVVLML